MAFTVDQLVYGDRLRVKRVESSEMPWKDAVTVVFEVLGIIPQVGISVFLNPEFEAEGLQIRGAIRNVPEELKVTAVKRNK